MRTFIGKRDIIPSPFFPPSLFRFGIQRQSGKQQQQQQLYVCVDQPKGVHQQFHALLTVMAFFSIIEFLLFPNPVGIQLEKKNLGRTVGSAFIEIDRLLWRRNLTKGPEIIESTNYIFMMRDATRTEYNQAGWKNKKKKREKVRLLFPNVH